MQNSRNKTIRIRPICLKANSPSLDMGSQIYTIIQFIQRYATWSFVLWVKAKKASITVNGQSLEIGKNLETALRYIRLRKKQLVLWADAICINQSDVVEKNYLVAAMSEIYQEAEVVIVFLGISVDCTEFLNACHMLGTDDACDDYRLDETFEHISTQANAKACLIQMVKLLKSHWWSRAWIVQEIAYAKSDPLIMIGRDISTTVYITTLTLKIQRAESMELW
ncbi:heterokaryon incompatibility protein-domain-containing protein [Stachybotrys elegans]|uniref:Heterokaryon incompatibility protein-domain-containing protein n=1 Tax=Stachybotrys elegans TaxID=80388 RepID=A0A8K0WVG0_9HYPO|nr:heterokaryon incompatibility protein-domain-containing protein [Stachybotrys elegans]